LAGGVDSVAGRRRRRGHSKAYDQNPTFGTWLANHEVPFVLAIRNDDVLVRPDGHRGQAKVLASIAGSGEGGG
jgi:hypothetical protein